jgi:hypothetical protein
MSINFINQVNNVTQKYFSYFIKERLPSFETFFQEINVSYELQLNYELFIIENIFSQEDLQEENHILYEIILCFIIEELKNKQLNFFTLFERYLLSYWLDKEIKIYGSFSFDNNYYVEAYESNDLNLFENKFLFIEIMKQIKNFKDFEHITEDYCIEDIIYELVEVYETSENNLHSLTEWLYSWFIPFIEYHRNFIYYIDLLFDNDLLYEQAFNYSNMRNILFNIPESSFFTRTENYKDLYTYIITKKNKIIKEIKTVKEIKDFPIIKDIVEHILVKYI